jgi:succinate dehydrogenase/fumarate reductase flavoprotein subunit
MEKQATETVTVDVLVVGAGVGGLSAAMSAGLAGLNVLIAEKTAYFGGTGARSSGLLWVPLNPLSVRDGIADSIEEARAYVAAEAGDMFNPVVVDSYLAKAPLMVETYAKHFPMMQFIRNDVGADNHPRQPGAKDKGRSLSLPPLDGRVLGAYRKMLAPPLETMTFLGMMVPSRDILHFFNIWRSRASFKVVMNLLFTYAKDLITCGQTMRIANGAALVSRMAKSAIDLDIPFWFNAPARELQTENGRVIGAVVIRNGLPVTVRARRGVVLATGGYPHDKARRQALAPIPRLAEQMHSAANPAAQGDGLRMAEAVGGKVENQLFNTLSWWPISRVPRSNGSSVVFPHMVDRSKPGFIMVSRSGRRFERETAIGNDIIRAMAAAAGDGPVEAWLIGDRKAVRRFGIGIVRPAPIPMGHHLRSGYVLRGRTLAELASKAGIDVAGLEKQVEGFNVHAARGEDPEFHRGESALEKRGGDPDNKPNPSLRPLDTPPFFAVKILPGDFSTLAGLRTDGYARVLNDKGQPITGLYAVGNDLSTMGGGHSPAGGFTIGQAVTFGFVAGQHLSGKFPD